MRSTVALSRLMASFASFLLIITCSRAGVSQTASVLTQHNDLGRSGANPNETVLTTSNVNEASFGKLFSLPVDGLVFAQPLYVPNVTIPGKGKHNVVYVATENDSVFAFDADSGAQYWQVSLGTPVPSSIVPTTNIPGTVGITSTPVIDPVSGTIYVAAKTWDKGPHVYRLHALDITTGAEKLGGPVKIAASVAGNSPDEPGGTITFDARIQLQRPALTLVNGVVYLAFGSHEDQYAFHGWLLGYDATTLQQVQAFNATPNGRGGAIWMSGQGLIADASNNLYLMTANSYNPFEDNPADYSESFVKLVPNGSSLTVGDYFKPNNYDYLNAGDYDVSAGGPVAIPGTSYIAGAGKLGLMYVVDTNNMGGMNVSGDQVVQEFQTAGGVWGAPVFWNNTMYYWGVGAPLQAFHFNGKTFDTSPSSQGAVMSLNLETGNGALAVSSNGTSPGTGIVWGIIPTDDPCCLAVGGDLYAFDAADLSTILWSTAQNESRDGFGNYGKFVAPTVVNGKVYVATENTPGRVAVYGLLSDTVKLGSLSQTYTGSPLAATATTTPSGLAVTFTYTGTNGTTYPTSSTPPTNVGSYTVVATINDPNYNGTNSGTLEINQATPAISWTAPTAITYGTALSATELDASSTVAGTLVYTPALGTVLKAGSQTLSVTFAPTDSANYTTATKTVSLTVNQATPTISWTAPAAITYGTALSATQLNASSTFDGSFAYTPALGTVLKAGSQTLSVTFTPTDTTDYTTVTKTVSLTVNQATPTISWTAPAAITYGTALSATQLDASSTVAGTFAYTPALGTVLKAGSQTLSVTFTPTDTTDYLPATKTVSLAVNQATPALSWTAPAAITYGTALGATQLDASSTVAGTLVYTPALGTVLKAGSQTLSVTFTPTDSANYTTATKTVSLTVNQATPTISWTAPAAITYGTALSPTQLNASTTFDGSFAYTPALGTVLKAGSQTLSVTFTPTDTTDYTTVTKTVSLTVNQATPTIGWTAPAAITYGTALSATQLDASSTVAGTLVYTPALGTVLKAGSQTLSVTFTPTDTVDYTTATKTVSLTVNQATPTIGWAAPAAITYGTALSATQLDASSTVAGTLVYTPALGAVLKAGSQTLSVTFTPTDTVDYTTATKIVSLTVNQATPTISWTPPAAITYGTALGATQLDASSTVAGTLVYTPASGTVLKAGLQTLSVTFTPTDTVDYTTSTATVSLTVNQATPTISWTAPAAITYGTALSATQLDASSTLAGTFVYTPALGTVLKAGSQTLSVTFTPTDTVDYTTSAATVSLTVNQAAPTISWTAPAAITYGTALSATQLDASSTVAGTLVYAPALGTVLKAGSQTLSVTFTPTDTTDYTIATKSVSLTVNQATPAISWAAPAAITYGTALSATQLDASSTVAGTLVYTPALGTVLKAGSQTLSVTFTPTDTVDYTTATKTVSLTVNQATPTISWTAPAAITYGTALGATQLDASSTVAGTLVYTPASGTVLKAGSQTLSVTFTPTDSANYTTATATVSLTVNLATPTINWSVPAPITFGTALSAAQLNASSTVAGTFAYTPALATVLKAGTQALSVTFTPTDSANYTTATATVPLTVNQATPTISWTAPAAITYGTALSATQLDASSTVAGTLVYTPALGTLLKAGSQTLSVTFTPTDTTDYTTATTTVPLTVNQATPTIGWAAPAAITYGTALSATQLDASSTVAGTFAYTPALGAVLKAGSQTLSVTFTPTDSANYTTATATVPLTVNQATPTISWTAPAAITYGTALSATQLDASSAVAGTLVFTPALGTLLKAGSQTLSVTFTPTDSTDYSAATTTVSLTVNQAAPTISWTAPAAITYGTALGAAQLNASSTVAGTLVYTPALGTLLKAGSQTLSVTFTPTDTTDYTAQSSSVTVTVNQATPTISWTTPAAITYGTALSAAQLDATSSTAGTFTYSPAAGTVLAGGSQQLSVTLNPTDATDYTTSTASVTLTVNQEPQTISLSSGTQAYAAGVTFGTPSLGLNATATSGLPVVFSLLSGPATLNGNSLAITGAGTVVFAANQAGNANYLAASQVTESITVSKAATVAAIATSVNPILAQNSITLTATATSSAGTPTGAVTFMEGATPLGTGTLAGGVATFTTSSLSVGAHTITASYGGDSNFLPGASTALTQLVQDFSFTISAPSVTAQPGGTAAFTFTAGPTNGSTFPSAINLTLSGLPTGATYTFSPATIAAGAGATTVTLTVNIPQTQASAQPQIPHSGTQLAVNHRGNPAGGTGTLAGRLAPFSLALVLLPFAGRLRRTGKRLSRIVSMLLLLAAGIAAAAGISACGGNTGFFAQPQQSYTVTVTGTSGALSHSTTVTLTVE